MKGFDAFRGPLIKSGRQDAGARAKMVILNIDHPDIRGIHRMQDEGRAQGACADRAGLRQLDLTAMRMLRIFFQKTRIHSGARDGRLHGAVVDDKDWWTKNVIDGQRTRSCGARFE